MERKIENYLYSVVIIFLTTGIESKCKGGQSVTHSIRQGGACMAKKKEKELTCTVEVTDGFIDRLTCGLVDILYQRRMRAEIEGNLTNADGEKTV